MTQHHTPEEMNQQKHSYEKLANFFFLYKDEIIIPHIGNDFLFIFTSPTKPVNVQVWKKSDCFIFKQPVHTVIIINKPTFTLLCLSTQNLNHQPILKVVESRDISNHTYSYVSSTLLGVQ
jgi:hypothetical protein